MTNQEEERFKIYKNVFDEFTLATIHKLSSQGHFSELILPVMMGKEANIFLAEKDDGYVIVKIYRLASCNFNKMYSYIKSDPRYQDLKNKRRLVIFKWVHREYRNLMLAREKILVPMPIAVANNVLVMESIGDDKPSPQLKEAVPKDMKEFASLIFKSIKGLADAELVHGDLSEFNILNHNEKPYFIDFSQSTSIRDPYALQYLRRDIESLARFFKKHKYEIDIEKEYSLIAKMIEKKNS